MLGTPVVALCGKVWVPSRDPERFPICPECQEIWAEHAGRRLSPCGTALRYGRRATGQQLLAYTCRATPLLRGGSTEQLTTPRVWSPSARNCQRCSDPEQLTTTSAFRVAEELKAT